MRIVIDMQGAQSTSRFRGIGRYTLSLSQAIVRNRGEHEVILALSGLFPDTIEPIRTSFQGMLPRENIRVWEAPGPVSHLTAPKWRREVAEYIREHFIMQLQPNMILESRLFGGLHDNTVTSIKRTCGDFPTAVILYDLIPSIYPAQYLTSSSDEEWYLNKLDHLDRADLLLSISESSRQEAIRHLQCDERSVINISAASSPQFVHRDIPHSRERELRRTLGLTQPFAMYTGGPDYRKNTDALIRAYAALPATIRERHQLAIVCSIERYERSRLQRLAKRSGLRKCDLVLTGFVADEELIDLYNICKVFIFPSLHEGFGLPALEAMSCGAAVVASNTTSLREVIEREDALFDPLDERGITDALAKVLTDDAFRRDLAQWGMARSQSFSWDRTAKRALSAFQQWHKEQESLLRGDSPKLNKPERSACRTDGIRAPHLNAMGYRKNTKTYNTSLSSEFVSLSVAIASVEHKFSDNELLDVSQCIARSMPPPTRSRQLLLDVTDTCRNEIRSGIQRVTRAVTRAFLENPPERFCIEPVYLCDQDGAWGYRYARKFSIDLLDRPSDERRDDVVEVWPGDVLLVLDISGDKLIQADDAGLFADYRNRGVAICFTIYDLLPVRLHQYFPAEMGVMFIKWLQAALRADSVICISRSVADDLRDWIHARDPRTQRLPHINWFPLGADLFNAAPTAGLPQSATLHLAALQDRSSFLMVGTIEPRKGHMQVLDAFEQLWNSGLAINLTIVGIIGWMNDRLVKRLRSHPMRGNMLFWVNACSDEYLEKIYAESSCLIAASEGEGFGLPLIEAARHKLPIIARDLPVFREVAGDYAFYFAGNASAALAAKIMEWLALHKAGKHPASHGISWVTWQQSVKRIEKIILDDCLQAPAEKSRSVNSPKAERVHDPIP